MAREQPHLRVLSYNVHKGFDQRNTRFLLEEIRHVVRLVNADLVFLQEVVGENVRHSRTVDKWVPETQFEYLADSVWQHYAYGKNAVYSQGHHGNAILSKRPFLSWENVDVSVFGPSQRGLLFGLIEPNIHVVCVHMGLLGWERRRQAQQLLEEIYRREAHNEPLIIAGDFNDWTSYLHRSLKRELHLDEAYCHFHGRLARTFPAAWPVLKMDRIYYRGFDLTYADRLSGSPWNALSDHCALYADFKVG